MVRRTAQILLGIAVVLLGAACSSALTGRGTALTPSPTPTAASGPSGGVPSGGVPSGGAPSGGLPTGGASSASAAQLAQLTALLEPGPTGSSPWTNSWGAIVNPTLEQFATHDYATSYVPTIEALLRTQGLTGIAHRTWIATNGTQADVLLLQFATPAGALSRFLFATEAKRDSTGQKPLTVTGAGDTVGYYATGLDTDGYVRAIVYSHQGSIVAQTFTYSPAHLDSVDTIAWAKAQYGRLP